MPRYLTKRQRRDRATHQSKNRLALRLVQTLAAASLTTIALAVPYALGGLILGML